MAKLVEIQSHLEGSFRLALSNREFIKEGKLKSVSALTGKKLERYIFLVISHPYNLSYPNQTFIVKGYNRRWHI